MDVEIHIFLTSALVGGEYFVVYQLYISLLNKARNKKQTFLGELPGLRLTRATFRVSA
jgi:hypothetical protein